MRITKIEITNFRAFEGTYTIELNDKQHTNYNTPKKSDRLISADNIFFKTLNFKGLKNTI